MTNPSKAKGTHGETRVVNWLKTNGFPDAKRIVLHGNKDQGDIAITRHVMAEVKNVADWTARDLNGWIQETRTEAANGQWVIAVLIVLLPHRQVPSALAIEITNTWQVEYVGSLEQWAVRHDTRNG